MTKQEAEILLNELVKPNQLFPNHQIPTDYKVKTTQPTNALENYVVCEPIYSQEELDEINRLTIIYLQGGDNQ